MNDFLSNLVLCLVARKGMVIRMRILFMGTPDFAAESLRALLNSGYEVVGAVTNPDKPKGRGHKLAQSPVKELATENNIPVFQPQSLRHGELSQTLKELDPDAICVAAYGKLLPKEVLDFPKYGCINVHGSLLPKYRGAAPIQWAVINGEKYSGITTMLMGEGLDTGDMLLKEQTEIGENETAAELFDRLAVIGGELLVKTLEKLEKGEIEPIAQNEAEATYVPMIKKEMALIDWEKSADEICCLIRGMNSWPMAYTYLGGAAVKIISAFEGNGNGEPGEVLGVIKKQGLEIACGKGSIIVHELQFAGSKRMCAEDYLRGHDIAKGSIFGE